uniref:Uncharacterized protein n=1 Tax=Xiphophorus couchianus TaxID=32473 RepID=A0A3B5LUJ2_9TELE
MDSPPKVSGETLIVHHIPLVHCQVSGGCGRSLKRTNPFSPPESLGLSRTTSLPERDVLQREALLYSSLIQTSSGSWSSSGGVGREKRGGGGRGGSTDSSFHLHSETNAALDDQSGIAEGGVLGFVQPPGRPGRPGTGQGASKTGSYSSGSSNQHCSCCTLSQNFPETFAEPFPDFQQGYCSDSSCNSSEGVLVNFSAIYNKMNNGIPEKQPPAADTSSVSDLHGNQQDAGGGGAFYLDLHTSPTEPPPSCFSKAFPLIREPRLSSSSACSCSMEHQATLDLDANCNSFHPPHSVGSSGDLASCLQSQARLVVATQNYYKLVTCDLSSQSSPSPAGSSVNSCSSEHSKGSPTPTQPSEYFLFRQRGEEQGLEEEDDEDGESSQQDAEAAAVAPSVIEGQVCPSPRLGSLERMLSCPMRLSDGAAQPATPPLPPPPRVTSFAEIARSKRRHGGAGGSPSTKAAPDPFSSTYSTHSHSSVDFSPILEQRKLPVLELSLRCSSAAPPVAERCYLTQVRRRWVGLFRSSENPPAVVRYSKDQRPTTLPIQPFTFHHQFTSKPPQPKPLLPLLTGYVSGMQARPGSGSGSGGPVGEESEEAAEIVHGYQSSRSATAPPTESVRPSPLGSYSPVRLQGAPSSGSCSTSHTPPPPSLGVKRGVVPPTLPAVQGQCLHHNGPALHTDTLSPLGCLDSGKLSDRGKGSGSRTQNVHHLSPQALKWREYRRRNPLGVERAPGGHSAANMELRRAGGPRPTRRNVFDFPTAPSSLGWPHGAQASLIQGCPNFFPALQKHKILPSTFDFVFISAFPVVQSGLVKAVNTAVDLIVAHFGTSRDPDVKAKLGNSWVSPNVGHLILKYLCPALRDLLQDGLKAYVLDLIIGQRRCQPWSVVEASTQLGPSTRVLHSLFSKVSQFSELTSHSMRLNAFVFGLLNMKSLEFWFNHLYTHEDIIAAHYSPWGFLPLSQGPCKPLFEELLLLLQPLSLLPFDLDLLFEPHLLQKGQEQLRRKEQLRSAGPSSRSTFQLMRGWSTTVGDMARRMERDGATAAANLWKERAKDVKERDRRKEKDPGDKQAGWWYQLMQSSQVYIDQSAEGSKFVKVEKRKKSSERRQNQPPPAREGVVEGAESEGERRASGGESRGRPSWMGSPPESVLNREKDPNTAEDTGAEIREESPSQGQSLRWGRLFGSTVGSPQRAEPPSGWLSLDRSILDLVAVTIGAGGGKKAENLNLASCFAFFSEVRALCHHLATDPGQLSFNKGDVLRVLRKADPDWLLCSLGSTQGLVPIIYVTLSSTEDSRRETGLSQL